MRMAHHGKRLLIRSLRATYVLAFLFAFSLFYFVIESGLLAWLIQNAFSISGVSLSFHVNLIFSIQDFEELQSLSCSSLKLDQTSVSTRAHGNGVNCRVKCNFPN